MASADRLFFYFGSDSGAVREASHKKVRELSGEDADEFAVEVIDGIAENSEGAAQIAYSVVEAVQTMPFLGGDKVVWLKSANFFADNVLGGAQATLEALEKFGEVLEGGLPEGVSLVISASAVDKRRSFFKKISKLAQAHNFEQVDTRKEGWENEMRGVILAKAKERSIDFAPEALEHFIYLVGNNSEMIDNELDKIDLYLGADSREVTREVVSMIASRTREGVVFEIGNAITARQLGEALRRMQWLFNQGENAVGILRAAIIPRVRDMLYAADLQQRHGVRGSSYSAYQSALSRVESRETAHLPRKKDGGINAYGLFLAAGSAAAYSVESLVQGMADCLRADEQLVHSGRDPQLVLSELLVRLIK